MIGNELVALAYLNLMQDLGVDINLSKSVVSRSNSLEFAKRVVINGQDLSPLGPKLLTQVVRIPNSAKELLVQEWSKDIQANYERLSQYLLFPISEDTGKKFGKNKTLLSEVYQGLY